jgi:Tol biopolymer transport system component
MASVALKYLQGEFMRKTVAQALLLLLFTCGCNTEPEFERNPNLFLLVPVEESMSAFNPVVAADGRTVYYLRGEMEPAFSGERRPASIWAVGMDGNNNRLVKQGRFGSLAISPGGEKLAVTSDASLFEGGLLVLMDTSGADEQVIPTSSQRVFDVEFSSEGSTLFYFADSAFYSIGTNGEGEQLLFQDTILGGLDICAGDSILFYYSWVSPDETGGIAHFLKDTSETFHNHKGFNPQFHPTDSRHLVFSPGWYSAGSDLKVLDLSDRTVVSLNAQTYPYSNTFGFPCWSPDGSCVVFSSSGNYGIDGCPPEPIPWPFELWVLRDVGY